MVYINNNNNMWSITGLGISNALEEPNVFANGMMALDSMEESATGIYIQIYKRF